MFNNLCDLLLFRSLSALPSGCLSCCSSSPPLPSKVNFKYPIPMMLNITVDTLNLQKINMNERMPKARRQAARKGRDRASLPGKGTTTYPYWMRLGVFLDRQDPKSGLSKENLEQRFFSKGACKPDRTRVAPLPGIEVEKLSEERLKELVTRGPSRQFFGQISAQNLSKIPYI